MKVKFSFGTRDQPGSELVKEVRAPLQWKQVHGVGVCEVVTEGQHCGDVDALWTRQRHLPIAINTADCVPILLYRKDLTAIAAIHAGWRGTVSRIVEHFFKSLPAELANASEWKARIGPCIHACCYEVSEDLILQFATEFSSLARKVIEPAPRKLDLVAVNAALLGALGVEVEWIAEDCTLCTQPKYFSYRNGDRKSRQYSVIELQ